jgi:hypothetical protein
MGMAHSTKGEVQRALKLFRGGALWSARDQSGRPSGAGLQRLLVRGLFLNVAIRAPRTTREYEVLRNSTPTVGAVHPGSALAKLANGAAPGKAAEAYFPQFVVFNSMLTTTRTYLTVVTPVDEEWIREESPEFYRDVVMVQMSKSRCEKISLSPVRLQTARVILGRYNQHKDTLESELNCSLQYDGAASALEVWCTRDALEDTRAYFESRISGAQAMALTDVEEEAVLGSTRAIYGAGGLVQSILFEGQYVSISVSGLPADASEEEVGALMRRYGAVRMVEVNSSAVRGSTEAGKKRTVHARVVFEAHADAARAYADLQGETIRGCPVTVSPAGIHTGGGLHASSSAQLVMSWPMSASACQGSLDMPSARAANFLLGLCNKGLGCPVLQGLGPAVRLRAKLPAVPGQPPRFVFSEQGKAAMCRLSISGLSPHVDEAEISASFEVLARYAARHGLGGFEPPLRVSVRRQEADSSIVDDDVSLSIQTANLRMCIPLEDIIETETSFFDSKFSNRAGFYLQYGSPEATDRAYAEWLSSLERWQAAGREGLDGSPLWLVHGQPIRMERKFQSHINVHSALWTFFQADFARQMEHARLQWGVTCRVPKPRRAIGAAKFNAPRTTVFLSAPSAPALQAALARLSAVLANSVYTPRNDAEKEILFSGVGRKMMVKISDTVTYLHWVSLLPLSHTIPYYPILL